MPHRILPKSRPAVLHILKTAGVTCGLTPIADRAITGEQWAAIDPGNPTSLASRFAKECADIPVA